MANELHAKPRIATAALAGCFGCHMSILDLDERLLQLAEIVDFDCSPINDYKDFTARCAVGIIEGGMVRNGVPEKVTIAAECRSLDHEKCMRLADEMKETFEKAAESIGARADVKLELAYKAVQISENAETVNIAKKALRSAGLEPRVHLICGGTDASIYNNKGIETVILGFGGKAEHSNDENIAVSDMETGVKMIRNILEQLSG